LAIDPNAKNDFPIRIAAEMGHPKVPKLLMSDARVNPSAKCNRSIRLASECGHFKVVELLLRVDPKSFPKWTF
jgi:hypothetical protein